MAGNADEMPARLERRYLDSWSANPVPNDLSSWQAASLPDIDAEFADPTSDGWLRDAPRPFDVRHERTAALFETNSGVTGCMFNSIDWDRAYRSVRMGYTNLYLREKRAVAVNGRVVRLWPKAYDAEPDVAHLGLDVLIPDDHPNQGCFHIRLGVGSPMWAALGNIERLSARMNGSPVLLVRLLASRGWH